MRPAESFISQPVRSLQTMLRVIGAEEGRLLTVIPDGIFGQQTQGEVARFQRSRGLPATGVADQATWERIAAEYPNALTQVGPAEPVQVVMNPGKVYKQGDRSYQIHLIQAMLTALSEIYGSMSTPQISGFFDTVTAEAVSNFQFVSGLPQTGEVDKVTWKHLALQYPLAVNKQETENREKR